MPRRAVLEVAAALATGILHILLFEALGIRGPFILVALIGWTVYFVVSIVRDRSLLDAWGFRRKGLRGSAIATGVFTLLATGAMAAYGAAHGTLVVNTHLLTLLLLYPIWGLVQQFLVQAMAVRNLRAVLPPAAAVLVAGFLFGLVHLPDLALSFATFGLGIALTPIYFRWRNLWPLGFCHGWLGALFYFWVLGSDPLTQMA